ncbi:ABC transporter ATP-binding protein [Specibacter cremeus]|uniref:ABC transporter ATP-binding protein n=1 Tax=Specibacter cremeus TaxID=1629051 RepID=UPI000F7817B6|nr:ABC transporter ATP-binding protein [Specibacter cremeus]
MTYTNQSQVTTPPHTRAPHTKPSAGAIALDSVSKSYGPVHAVRDLSLEISPGETVALLGPNGAGKSTTIGMLLGLVAADAGKVTVCGRQPRLAVAHGRIAAMLQDAGLMPGVRVREIVGLAASLYPAPMPVGQALSLAGLSDVAKRRVDRLSGGQAQRVRFAMAAVANPEILVLDEPTRALDVAGRTEFWQAMQAYSASGRTLVFATHYLDEVSGNASRVVVLMHGQVVADGVPEEVSKLAGASTIRFTADARPPQLGTLPGVSGVSWRHNRASLRTAEPDTTLRALMALDLGWRDIEITPPSLNDSFLMLTQEGS